MASSFSIMNKSKRDSITSINSFQNIDNHLKVAAGAMNHNGEGGLIVIGETVTTLHKEIPGSKVNIIYIYNLAKLYVCVHLLS